MADYMEAAEEDIKKASNLAVLMLVGVIISFALITFAVWVLYSGGVFGSGEFFGGTMIMILWYLSQIFLIIAVILLFLRSAYGVVRILLIINIFTGIISIAGFIFSIIGSIKLSKTRKAFPLELERDKRTIEAEAKVSGKKVKKLELECPECSKDFMIKDTGKRPLPIKCPHCGVAGEI
ncbi:MAG: hypothetical protein QF682_04055 [Candidatus Thermoplasmatota archaeon]|nr:hypothetical protein [Candidatus Thermoplasmatota archaeon]